jgi:hypothetical protein
VTCPRRHLGGHPAPPGGRILLHQRESTRPPEATP